ncbi:MAG: hypothetical protein ABIT20_23225 [Gemmatimonadaceae bacterium]
MGSSRRESFRTSSAFAAAITTIATAPSAARAADHSAIASPLLGDSAATASSRHNSAHALVGSIPMLEREMTRAVEFLLFTAAPAMVRDTHIESFSGAM